MNHVLFPKRFHLSCLHQGGVSLTLNYGWELISLSFSQKGSCGNTLWGETSAGFISVHNKHTIYTTFLWCKRKFLLRSWSENNSNNSNTSNSTVPLLPNYNKETQNSHNVKQNEHKDAKQQQRDLKWPKRETKQLQRENKTTKRRKWLQMMRLECFELPDKQLL